MSAPDRTRRVSAPDSPGRVSSPDRPPDDEGTISPWRGTTPELAIACVLIAATALAGYAVAGWAGLSVVAVSATAIAMVVLRGLLPQLTPDMSNKAAHKATPRLLSGYSHRRFVVRTAMTDQGFYDSELRPVLEHLLAARLAERHSVHLYQDPESARRLLCRNPRDADLWAWVDPATRPDPDSDAPGSGARRSGRNERVIPRRTLTRLIDRLEKL